MSAYTKRVGGDFQSYGNKRKLSRREIVIVYSCACATAGYSSRRIHTRARSRLSTRKKETETAIELSIRDMIIIWLLGDGSPRHTHVSCPHSYGDMIIPPRGPRPLCTSFHVKKSLALAFLSFSPPSLFFSLLCRSIVSNGGGRSSKASLFYVITRNARLPSFSLSLSHFIPFFLSLSLSL